MDEQSIISAIDVQIAKLEQVRSLLANGSTVRRVTTRKAAKEASAPLPKKRTMSAKARKRIADAQRKRWAATREQASTAPAKAAKKAAKKAASKRAAKRIVSPEARKRMADAQRKRWAAAKKPKSAAPAKAARKAAKKSAPKKTANSVPMAAVPEAQKAEGAS